jgi:septal ring factor EnvC (AmiA/AmiB activator)
MNSQKIAGDVKGYSKVGQDLNGNFNDVTMSSLKTKYEILEENYLQLVKAVKDNNTELGVFDGKREMFLTSIDDKAKQIEDNVGNSITKMDAEIQKSLSHQKAENSRLDQQINQLKVDNNIIKNQLLIVQKRIEDIQVQIGEKF